jgi:TonB-dependent receptor
MPWSEFFPGGTLITPSGFHPITESLFDVDYKGRQEISAWYAMMELPLVSNFRVVGGARSESTYLSTVNEPEEGAIWFPPGSVSPAALTPGAADVDFQKDALLPAIGIAYDPFDQVTLRASYSETVARQTFKEITPIVQQEYAGAPIFIGNPELGMSELQNYDLRLDYRPYRGSLLSLSWFYKDITDPIEYVQRLAGFNFTTARNYPKGTIQGWELEARQDLGLLWDPLRNLSVGANATFLDSIVYLPEDEIEEFELPNIQAPMESRDMTNAPDQLFNFYVTYEIPVTGTQMAVFYTVQGDTLIAGAGQSNGNYVPNVYATQFETLNVSLTQRLGPIFRLQVQGKNLTNPTFQTVYRSEYIGEDVLRTSFTSGIALSVSLSAAFSI